MIGYRSVQHQGWFAARAASVTARDNNDALATAGDKNPYPHGSSAFYEYQDGCNAWRRGDMINCRGDVEKRNG